jgi:2'-5' RNA ligase
MIDKKEAHYFLALIPPSPIFEYALELKNHFHQAYQSKASLNSPPHITLHMPFKWKRDKEAELISKLADFVNLQHPFNLELSNFSSFPPKVIFIDVALSKEILQLQQELQRFCKRELNLFNATYKEQPFHPHLTLAFRDLKKPMFEKAWEEFKNKVYHDNFLADKLILLKHNGKFWESYKEFSFNAK